MYIAVVQNNPRLGALKENAEKILESIDSLALSTYPPDLVIFPAYALTGTPAAGLQISDSFAAETLDAARLVIEKTSLPALIGTMIPRPIPDELSFMCEPEVLFCKDGKGGALGFVDLSNSWELDNYASSIITTIDGTNICILLDEYPDIDEDYSDTQAVVIMMAKEYEGTNTIFTASDQLSYLRDFASANHVWVVLANLVGAQDISVFDGASIVIKPDGSVACAAVPFEEGTITCNINLSKSNSKSADQSDATGKQTLSNKAKYHDECLVRPLLPYEADWKALELFVRDYVHKNGFSDVVLGISGGLDSAVVATIACDALGAEHVHGILMPGPFSSKGSIDDSRALALNLGIQTLTIPIDAALEAFRRTTQEVIGQEGSFLAQQNIQNRIRMVYLMQLSNSFGWLLLCTGNKSEKAMGYSTLYGDTAGALAPLGNIYKTDVYGLANWRNEQSLVIPEVILTKPPSAELYEGQIDEDSLPPYALLDHILRLHIEEGLGVDQILEYATRSLEGEKLSSDLIEQVLDSVKLAEFKRRQAPPSPALGYVDMCQDRDWPITNGFRDHFRILPSRTHPKDFLRMMDSWQQPGGWDFLAN